MKRTHFRIRLFPAANKVAELTALKAAQFNADIEEFDINLLFAFGTTVKELGEEKNSTTVEMVGENQLIVDCKVNGNWVQGLIIDQVEVFENLHFIDEDDIKADILSSARYPKN